MPPFDTYYNDNDEAACRTLHHLMNTGLIDEGCIDGRSIEYVRPEDVEGFTTAHFFAGIAGWEHALRLARWSPARPVWTASLPCQPFSNAGKRKGEEDERHLWPVFRDLVAQCSPGFIVGEQVASKAGRSWFAVVQTDLEALGYTTAAADLCAASLGAPHIRQRLFWVAYGVVDTPRDIKRWPRIEEAGDGQESPAGRSGARGGSGRMAVATSEFGRSGTGREDGPETGDSGGLGESIGAGQEGHDGDGAGRGEPGRVDSEAYRSVAEASWSDCEWVWCADGKYRPVEPGTHPLAVGVPQRVDRLRGYGNSIVPIVAAEFLMAVDEALGDLHG